MDSFYLIVLGVATLVLILMLAFLGWTMSKTKKGSNYPTIVKTCPDNWKVEKIGEQVLCKRPVGANRGNVSLDSYMGLSTSPGHVVGNVNYLNFDNALWSTDTTTPNPNCAKRNWAKKYEIKWDSINSANYCD